MDKNGLLRTKLIKVGSGMKAESNVTMVTGPNNAYIDEAKWTFPTLLVYSGKIS